jgi:glycerate kinase
MSGTVLVAPDSFKGTFGAPEVAAAIGRGVARATMAADLCPVADGGEGTMETLLSQIGGRTVEVDVHDPLGREIRAPFALLGPDGRRAIVETAAASGLALVAEHERDPWAASTYGTGELIRAAVEAGAREILVAVGGSATVDGGRGALQAIERSGGIEGARVEVLCDVATPWERCAEIYGPQKGADPGMVRRLAARLDELAGRLPRDPRGVAMTGAAGGLSGGLWAALDATLVPGARYVLDAVGFDRRLEAARCVVAGEGRLDAQSFMGKIIGEISTRAAGAHVPVHAIVGRAALAEPSPQLSSVIEAGTLAELESAGERLARLLRGQQSR